MKAGYIKFSLLFFTQSAREFAMSHHQFKSFLGSLLHVFSILPLPSMSSSPPLASYGFDFQVGTFPNFGLNDPSLQLVVGTLPGIEEQQTSFVVESLSGVIHNGTTSSSNPAYVDVSNGFFIVSSSALFDRQKGIRVYSTGEYPISVLLVNYESLTYGAYLAQPLEEAGMRTYTYHAISVQPSSNGRSVILLVARDDNTTVTVNLPVLLPKPIVLGRLQTYLIASEYSDLTGAKVESNKPLNVMSGNECGFVPSPSTSNCDQLSEQLPPTSTWGKEFLLVPFAGRTVGQFYKVVSSQDGTTVSCSCICTEANATEFTMSFAGGYHQFHTDSSTYCYLIATKPVLVAQLQPGAEYTSPTNTLGDPTMTILPALEQYPNEVSAIPLEYTDFEVHFINIAVTENSVLLDSNFISGDQWTEIWYNGRIVGYGIQINITAAPVHVKHTNPANGVGVMAYGYGYLTSYSYTAGKNLREGNSSKKTLYERSHTCDTFHPHCINALVC